MTVLFPLSITEYKSINAQTYREQHNRDGQSDSGKDSHSHTKDQRVIRINPAICVQQFRLHLVCRNIKRTCFLM